MEKNYQAPEAQIVNFAACEALAVIQKEEDLGEDPTIEFVSRSL